MTTPGFTYLILTAAEVTAIQTAPVAAAPAWLMLLRSWETDLAANAALLANAPDLAARAKYAANIATLIAAILNGRTKLP